MPSLRNLFKDPEAPTPSTLELSRSDRAIAELRQLIEAKEDIVSLRVLALILKLRISTLQAFRGRDAGYMYYGDEMQTLREIQYEEELHALAREEPTFIPEVFNKAHCLRSIVYEATTYVNKDGYASVDLSPDTFSTLCHMYSDTVAAVDDILGQ